MELKSVPNETNYITIYEITSVEKVEKKGCYLSNFWKMVFDYKL